jgi:hypothetical protein
MSVVDCQPRYFIHRDGKVTRSAAYQQHLLSPGYGKKRDATFKRARFRCEVRRRCKGAPATAIHHRTYLNIGYEFLGDLMAVCYRCHAWLHEKPDGSADGSAAPAQQQLDLFKAST